MSPPDRRISTAWPMARGCGSTGWTSKYFAMPSPCHADRMSDEADRIEIVDNPARGRFELLDDGRVIGVASYAVVAGGGA